MKLRCKTLTQFLAWEEHQPTGFEFDGFQPAAMTGGAVAHSRMMPRLHRALGRGLEGQSCEPFRPDVKIVVDGSVRCPDAVVSCVPQNDRSLVIENPVVVFEALSGPNSSTDRIAKVREYQATASILRHVILEQDSIGAMVFERRDANWAASTLTEGDRLVMPEISVEIVLADPYTDPRRSDANHAVLLG